MILSPSDIHFLGALDEPDSCVSELCARFGEEGGSLPKVQVAEKDGAWFALNNSSLHLARHLQRRGRCDELTVEVVPLSKVPPSLQKGMTVDKSRGVVSGHVEDTSDDTSSSYSSSSDQGSDTEEDEDLCCNVCERSFPSALLLSQHQQRRRHFGCSVCDSCFPDLRALEVHKESLDHWSEDDGNTYESDSACSDNNTAQEMERLL